MSIISAPKPALMDNRTMTRSRVGERVVTREPSMARSWGGRTIFACVPGIVTPRSPWSPYSYANNYDIQECYECAALSRKNVGQTSLPPPLMHKRHFAYEWSDRLTCPAAAVLLEPRLIGARRGSREHVGCSMLSSTHVRTIVPSQGGPMPANTTSQPENLRNPVVFQTRI